MTKPPTDYHSYLDLDRVLSAQKRRSEQFGSPAHDEWLFIITHQTYELWFKQILIEIDSVIAILEAPRIREEDMGLIVGRLERVVEIQKVLIDQIRILETMTPLDFLEFRDCLYPASGFQSYQFRLVENKLGLKPETRLTYNQAPYHAHLPANQKAGLERSEADRSLFGGIEAWLERTPFLEADDFDFWKAYREAVATMFAREREIIGRNAFLTDADRSRNLEIVRQSEDMFAALFDRDRYERLRAEGHWRLSYRALHAALFIQLYRDQPVLHLPFRLLTTLLDVDELMTTWRYRHALMARRMLGTKIGTGGSSGFQYLRDSTEKHKIFTDFFQLTTFFIKRSDLPPLPSSTSKRLGFFYEG